MPEATTQEERAERWREWMAQAQRGDGEAYGQLLAELLPFLRAEVRRRLGDDAAVEDVSQEILIRVHMARHTYRAERPLMPWLRTITRNAIIDQARRRSRLLRRSSMVEPEMIPHEPQEHPELERLSPALERAIEALPATQREAVWLLKVEGLTVSEAAARVGISGGALKLRAHRGYRGLRDLLGREKW